MRMIKHGKKTAKQRTRRSGIVVGYPFPKEQKDMLGRHKVIGLKTIGEGVNPKDKIGAAKVDMTLLSTHAKIAWALAQMDGGDKYGVYNYRVEPIQIRTYLSAAYRHLDAYLESEELAPDSLTHHLGHVMACCGILIDAAAVGKLIDDRPVLGQGSSAISRANDFIKNQKPKGWGR